MPIDPKKNEMPTQSPEERVHNFDEVALGYTYELALKEASRCLNCKNKPCVSGCPVNVDIPNFINCIKQNDLEGAYRRIAESSSLPAVCGRVCPQEHQCEKVCTLGKKFEPVAIGRLERFVADEHIKNSTELPKKAPSNGIKTAVIGSGPAGLSCAGDLVKLGYDVTVYEALHTPGGVLVYGIPEFRLPKSIVENEIETLKKLGVKIETNVIIGKTLTVDELFEMGFSAVFIGSGAGLPNFMNIPGESLKGVYSANEFLTRTNLMKAYLPSSETPVMKGGYVTVIGGGNVAMDCARTALRLGADKVRIVYRRSMEELPARREEVEHAIDEGVEFHLLTNPLEFIPYENKDDPKDRKNGSVKAVSCIKTELGAPDEKGRRRPTPIKGSEFTLNTDTVIIAVGTSPNPLIKNTTENLSVNSRGGIIVTEDGLTSREGVYAGGDAVTGAATVISAMGAGKIAAASIDNYLKSMQEKK